MKESGYFFSFDLITTQAILFHIELRHLFSLLGKFDAFTFSTDASCCVILTLI